jgi:hypothetical protein
MTILADFIFGGKELQNDYFKSPDMTLNTVRAYQVTQECAINVKSNAEYVQPYDQNE